MGVRVGSGVGQEQEQKKEGKKQENLKQINGEIIAEVFITRPMPLLK